MSDIHEVLLGIMVEPSPGFDVVVDPAAAVIKHGGSGTFSVTILPKYGFTGRVNLSIQGVPEWNGGVTATFSAAQIGVGETSVLTIAVHTDQAAPSFNMTVKGEEVVA